MELGETHWISLVGLQEVERVKGIEPSYAVWKTAVLPLNYTRIRSTQIIPTALAMSIRRR